MNKNKINRNKISKYFARFGLIIMAFVIMIPMLCSAAAPTKLINVTIQNPDNIPQDIDFSLGADTSFALNFGDNVVDSFLISVVDSKFVLSSFEFFTDVPDGDYYYVEIKAVQSSGYSNSLVCNGNSYTVTNSEYPEYPVTTYVSDNPVITVIESNESFTSLNIPILIPVTPTPTESITNVWTAMLNWFTSALNSIQGLFITYGYDNDLLEFKAGTYRFNDVVNVPVNFSMQSDELNYFTYHDSRSTQLKAVVFNSNPQSIQAISMDDSVQSIYVDPIPTDNEFFPNSHWLFGGYLTVTVTQDYSLPPSEQGTFILDWLRSNTNYNEVNANDGGYELTIIGILVILSLAVAISLLILRRVVMCFQLH